MALFISLLRPSCSPAPGLQFIEFSLPHTSLCYSLLLFIYLFFFVLVCTSSPILSESVLVSVCLLGAINSRFILARTSAAGGVIYWLDVRKCYYLPVFFFFFFFSPCTGRLMFWSWKGFLEAELLGGRESLIGLSQALMGFESDPVYCSAIWLGIKNKEFNIKLNCFLTGS